MKIKQRIRFWNSLNFDSETYLSSSFRKRGVIFRTKVFGRKTRIKIDIPLPPYRNQNFKTIPTCVFHADKCLGRWRFPGGQRGGDGCEGIKKNNKSRYFFLVGVIKSEYLHTYVFVFHFQHKVWYCWDFQWKRVKTKT